MSKCGSAPLSGQRHLLALSTTVVYEWFTEWMPSIGLNNVKAAIKRRGLSGNFQCQLAIQTAIARTDKPNGEPPVVAARCARPRAATGKRTAGCRQWLAEAPPRARM